MKLSQLLSVLEIEEAINNRELEIAHVAYDSRKVVEGDVFVCVKGYVVDGHDYIDAAIAKGAVAIVVEDVRDGLDIPQYKVKDTRIALASLADMYYGHPSSKVNMIGITATNGKTTTSFMVDSVLEAHGLSTGLIGTVLVKYGDFSEAAYLTTPESLDLHHFLHDMKAAEVSHVCMEVSSSALELSRVGCVDFDIVTLNNISREHIDLHGSFEEYYAAKASLIREAKEGAWAVLNLDDPYSKCLIDETKASVLTYGIDDSTGDLVCKNVDLSTGRAVFEVEITRDLSVGGVMYEKGCFEVNLGTPGYHSVYNAMAAIGICILTGVPIQTIVKGLFDFKGVERRFEIIYDKDYKIVDDHFANAGNIEVTLKTLVKMDYKDLVLVYAIRGSRGAAVISEAAETMVKWAKDLELTEVVASLSKSHITWKDEVVEEEIELFTSIMKDAGIAVRLYDELDDAISDGLDQVGQGDVLMLAGCQGMDYGAKVALKQIHERRPDIDLDDLYAPLVSRVAGGLDDE